MPDGLLIHIGADVSQGLAGVRSVRESLTQLNQSTLNLVRSLKNDLDPNITAAFRKGAVSVHHMRSALETLKENMRLATNPAQIIQYNRAIKDLELNIKKVGVAGVVSGNAMSAGFTKGFSALRNLALILPGVGVAGIAGFAISGITDFIGGLTKVKNAYSAAATQAEAFRNANKSIGDDVARLNALVAVARDVSFSTQQRTNAIAELQKLYPGYLRNITLENINSAAAKLAIDELTKSLVSKAIAQAYSTKIAEESLKADDLRAVVQGTELRRLKDQLGFLGQVNKARDRGRVVSNDAVKNQELGQARYNREIQKTIVALGEQESVIADLFERTKRATAQSLDFVATPGGKLPKVKVEAVIERLRFITPIAPLDLPIEEDAFAEIRKKFASIFDLKDSVFGKEFGKTTTDIIDDLNKKIGGISDETRNAAAAISNTLTPAFQGLFNSILAGEDPLKAFFNGIIQGINQLISKLIAAAIQAAVLSIFTGGTSSFGSLFGKVLGFGGQSSPRAIGYGGQAIRVNLSGGFQLRGNDLLLSVSRTQATQGRGG